MSTFITRLDGAGTGPRVAIKDLIDVAGVLTTAGCRAVAVDAVPAARDAQCMAGVRAADARIVGKTNLHELAFGVTGINVAYGTPENPLDAELIPGGSSSGSAVAVGSGEADVALGTDTGGSVRVPAACCGVAGLKTTHGRVSLAGVHPLAPSLDTVGPLAVDVAGLVLGMQLLEPGFTVGTAPRVVGRLQRGALDVIDAAVDAALAAAGFEVRTVELPGWDVAYRHGSVLLIDEAWQALGHLLERRDLIDASVAWSIEAGSLVTEEQRTEAAAGLVSWRAELAAVLADVDVLALPTIPLYPWRVVDDAFTIALTENTLPINAAGLPALAVPVPAAGTLPASLQLIGPRGSEETLLAAGFAVEAGLR